MNDIFGGALDCQYANGDISGTIKAWFCIFIVAVIVGLGVCVGLAIGHKVGA